MATKVYKTNHECNVSGTFTKETKDVPDKNMVENLAIQFPELPMWMLNAAVLCHNKNPNYAETGQLGKKPMTGKEKRKQKREEFKVAPEWFGETPEERTECRSQEDALLFMKMGGEPTGVIRKPEEDFVKKIVDDL